jgi:hypothetical protein
MHVLVPIDRVRTLIAHVTRTRGNHVRAPALTASILPMIHQYVCILYLVPPKLISLHLMIFQTPTRPWRPARSVHWHARVKENSIATRARRT